MDDTTTAILAGQTTKYKIPLSHFEHKYIQNCTDGKELERIYKELTGGEIGSFVDLEKLTLDRIRDVKPNSQLLRQDKAPLDKSALPDDERQNLDDFLNQMKDTHRTSSIVGHDHQNNGIDSVPIRTKSIVSKSITPVSPTTPVINNNGKQKRLVPKSYDEWGKLEKKMSRGTNSDNEDEEDEEEEEDDDHDQAKKTTNKSHPKDQNQDKSQRLQMAEQHRLNGNTAFKSNNYQQSIDLYTKSVMLDTTNPVVYMNRAIAYYKLNKYDESIVDCSKVLSSDPRHIKALFRRASCRLAQQQYDEAKRDLDMLLNIEPENNEAKNLLTTIPTAQKPKGVRIPITEVDGDDEQVDTQPSASAPLRIPILEVEEEEEDDDDEDEVVEHKPQLVNDAPNQSMNIDIPQRSNIHARPGIDSQEASPAMFDHHFHHRDDPNQFHQDMQFQSSLNGEIDHNDNDDDDDMALGDEAGAGLPENMSDDDGNISPSLNVSPTMDDDDDAPELVDHKPLRTPPLTPPARQTITSNAIDHSIAYTINETYNRKEFSAISTNQSNDDFNDLYDNNNNVPTVSNNYSAYKRNTTSSNSFETNDNFVDTPLPQRPSTTHSNNDQISNSNFSPLIQSWLRDLVELQSIRRPASSSDRPWSRSSRPYSLDKLQRDIERFNRLSDFKNAIEASKKMLKNGVLDYHSHADHIVSTLILCAQCCLKTKDHIHAIQFATEALQYNKMDSNALTCRAKAFENENFLLFSYADYARIKVNDYNYSSAQLTCEKLAKELKVTEGETWREKLPQGSDDERYITFIKNKDNYSDNQEYEWYRLRGNQLYLDACFVLSIQCYTHCIKLKPDITLAYLNRAVCYYKVFEPQKTIDDCDIVLKSDPNNVRALYRKASAYKMARNDQLYKSILKDLIQLQPNNQTILAEYYTSRHEQIPRKMRRIRTNTNDNISISSTSVEIKNSTSTIISQENNLSFEELEQIRKEKGPLLSTNTPYQFTQQLTALKSNDIKGQCSLILRLPPKSLFKLTNSANSKLVETIVNVCRTMVHAEKRYQQDHPSSIVSFSYITFSFNILIELTTLPRIETTLLMIDPQCRASLDDLLSYYYSISSMLNGVNKLDRLRK